MNSSAFFWVVVKVIDKILHLHIITRCTMTFDPYRILVCEIYINIAYVSLTSGDWHVGRLDLLLCKLIPLDARKERMALHLFNIHSIDRFALKQTT